MLPRMSYPKSLQVLIVMFESPPQVHVPTRHRVENVRVPRVHSLPPGCPFRVAFPGSNRGNPVAGQDGTGSGTF